MVFDLSDRYTINSPCNWLIYAVFDWACLHLINLVCIWSLKPVLVYWVCNWLVQPVHDLLYLILFYSNCIELIQAVFNPFHLYMMFLFDPAYLFVQFNLYLTYSICNQSIPTVYSWFDLNVISLTWTWLIPYVLCWFHMCMPNSTCIRSIHTVPNLFRMYNIDPALF